MSYESQEEHSEEKTHVITVNPTHNHVVNDLLTTSGSTMPTRYGGLMNDTWFITSLGKWNILCLQFRASSGYGLEFQDVFKILRVA